MELRLPFFGSFVIIKTQFFHRDRYGSERAGMREGLKPKKEGTSWTTDTVPAQLQVEVVMRM